MKSRSLRFRDRLGLEHLESRWCPAISVSNANNVLTITGDPESGTLTVTQTAPGQWSVTDGGLTLGPVVAIRGVSITLQGDDDVINLNSAGAPVAGNVSINSGDGNDAVNAGAAGPLTIAGLLQVSTANGDDTVDLGNAGGALTVQGLTSVNSGTGALDEVNLRNAASILQGDFVVQGANFLTVEGAVQGRATVVFNDSAGSGNSFDTSLGSVVNALSLVGSADQEIVTLNGNVTQGVTLNLGNGTNQLNFDNGGGSGAVIGGALQYTGGSDDDTLLLGGRVNGATTVNLGGSSGGGNNFELQFGGQLRGSVTLSADGGVTLMNFLGGSTVAGNLSVTTRGTTNTFTMAGAMGGGRFTYAGGGGADGVTWNASSGAAYLNVSLGAGDDSFTLSSARYGGGLIDGGAGTDVFNTTAPLFGITVKGFEM